jgi:hypothetical protein
MELKELDENCCKAEADFKRESLLPAEVKLLFHIIKSLLIDGSIPLTEELSSDLRTSLPEILRLIESLKNKGYIYIDPDSESIKAVYPLSSVPTQHRVIVGKHSVFANCAIDALGVPLMLNRTARVLSICAECGGKIEIEVKKGGKVLKSNPTSTVVFSIMEIDFNQPAVLTCCPYINFFCSFEHASEWSKNNPNYNGKVISIKEATRIARKIFGNLLTETV